MKLPELGQSGLNVSEPGLGCMGLTGVCGAALPEAVAMICAAEGRCFALFDGAEAQWPFAGETLPGKDLAQIRDIVVIATKVGFAISLATGVRAGGTNIRLGPNRTACPGPAPPPPRPHRPAARRRSKRVFPLLAQPGAGA